MAAKSFTAKILSDRKDRLYGIRVAFSPDQQAWYFILVEPAKEQAFLKVLNSDAAMELTDYGQIIASGWGAEVPGEVKHRLKEEYDFDVR